MFFERLIALTLWIKPRMVPRESKEANLELYSGVSWLIMSEGKLYVRFCSLLYNCTLDFWKGNFNVFY